MQGPRGARNIARNCEEPENRSAELQGRQREVDEREKLDKCLSVAELKLVARSSQEWLKERGRRQVS
jgi:hypothetical protein